MTYVFGDIHGCLNSFNLLLKELSPRAEDTIVTLGDYIDRGPCSKGVIDRLIALRQELTVITLRGNHEMMMQEARNGPPASSFWLLNGGIETLHSFYTRSLAAIPPSYWDFFAQLAPYHESESILFCHATPPPDKAAADCDEEELLWLRFRDLQPREDGRLLICGHTPQKDRLPKLERGHLCLDTGSGHGGYLTALTVETGDFLQANEEGELRRGHLPLPKKAD
ncbi:metallophosphoesterase family protein [Roseibacillus ishigakijimensis]|uniref:Serine/threonine protein phosphatase n=1 Tax=Roseibacillus ishigakijimensis TaxID=454146 RepID=A0A934VN49_9BACT|nr:metallophosphoesterase family protein [Roseibacillus ishigakijimensis]MBK1834650.1 serine/threonine protein phosphatase [Roseibacillus ishigakijimensis]